MEFVMISVRKKNIQRTRTPLIPAPVLMIETILYPLKSATKRLATILGTSPALTSFAKRATRPSLILIIPLLAITLVSCAQKPNSNMLGDTILNISIFRATSNLSDQIDPLTFAQQLPETKLLQQSLVIYNYELNRYPLIHQVDSFATDSRYFIVMANNGEIFTNSNSCQTLPLKNNPLSMILGTGVLSAYMAGNKVVDYSIFDCEELIERTVTNGKYTLAGIFSTIIDGNSIQLYLPGSEVVYDQISMPNNILAIYPSQDGKHLYIIDDRSNISLYSIEEKRFVDGAQMGLQLVGATAKFSHGENANGEPSGKLQIIIPQISQLQYYLIDLELGGVFSPTLANSGSIDANLCFFSQATPTVACDDLVLTSGGDWVPVPGLGLNFAYINDFLYYINNSTIYVSDLEYTYKQSIETNWRIPQACTVDGSVYFTDFDGIEKAYSIADGTLSATDKPRRCSTLSYRSQDAAYYLADTLIFQFADDVTPALEETDTAETPTDSEQKLFLRVIGRSYYYFSD